MRISSAFSTNLPTIQAVNQGYSSLKQNLGDSPNLLFAYGSVSYNIPELQQTLKQLAPDTLLIGGTSCQGVMTEAGYHAVDGVGMGLLGLLDPEGNYGVGSARIELNQFDAGAKAILDAVENAGRPGEIPDLIWLVNTPGHEERILQGIQSVIGTGVPIFGGSVADDTVEGEWFLFSNQDIFQSGVIVAALYSSATIHHIFHSGYFYTQNRGFVTRAEGRVLYEIDGESAIEKYNIWTDGVISEMVHGGNILSLTTLSPLGRLVGQIGSTNYYRLSHPESVTSDGGLKLFSDIEKGEEVVLMTGTKESLIKRPGRLIQSVIDTNRLEIQQICGAMVVYCAGCMLTVQDQMDLVAADINQALGGLPYLGIYTFGEQGCFIGGENHHGNLMISIVLFES